MFMSVVDGSTESAMLRYSTFLISKYQLHPWISKVGGEGKREEARAKVVCRIRNGSSPYFCNSSSGAPFGCRIALSIDGWMRWGGKGEKGSSSVRAPSSLRGLLVVFPVSIFFFISPSLFLSFYFRVFIPFSLSPFNSLSLSLSSSFICLLHFRYLIKSSYDEKDEATARSAVFPFLFTGHRSSHASARWNNGIMRSTWKPRVR